MSNGYFNMAELFECEQSICSAISMRGPGKTFNALAWLIKNASEDRKYIFMRRTNKELRKQERLGMYKKVCSVNNMEPIQIVKADDDITYAYRGDEHIGSHLSLHGVAGVNGIDMSEYKYWFFDEIIPTRGGYRKKKENEIMEQAYETINRNRELEGEPAIKLVMCGNMHEPFSEILSTFGYTDELDRMGEAKPLAILQDEDRKLVMINQSPIAERKRNTVLYRVNNNDKFQAMALDNTVISDIMPLKDYGRKAYVYQATVGEININKLKDSNKYYLTKASEPGSVSKTHLRRWCNVYNAYIKGNTIAQSNYVASKFVEIFNG